MSYSPVQGSPTNTHIRNAGHAADISGMCAVCSAQQNVATLFMGKTIPTGESSRLDLSE